MKFNSSEVDKHDSIKCSKNKLPQKVKQKTAPKMTKKRKEILDQT